jgi:hypothetical protein
MAMTRKWLERLTVVGGLVAGLLTPSPASSQEKGDPRGVAVEQVRNERPAFMVRVSVDRPNRVYRGKEEMRVSVVSEREGYLYLFYCDANQKISCLFPNQVQKDNRIPARKTVSVPAPDANFKLRIQPPYGREILKAVVTREPLKVKGLDEQSLTKGDVTELELENLKGVAIETRERRPADWAEHNVEILTVAPDGRVGARQPRRVGVFIGISDYLAHPKVPNLSVGHEDARLMAAVMKQHCRLDGEPIVLLNNQATLKNIEDVLRRRLPAATQPGDTVILYWSGHGGRFGNTDGTEKDGYDECLVPYDGRVDDVATIRRTMLTDDTFGRWVQELEGRKLVVILDACHSAGVHNRGKDLSAGNGNGKELGTAAPLMSRVFARAKDLGQRESALLASSTAAQISFERRERDCSVMTYYLLDQLRRGNGPVTLSQAFAHLEREVPAYVKQAFRGSTQNPVLIDETTPPLYLRP